MIGCKVLAGREYRKRHNRMGLRVYWELCKLYGIKCSQRWYEECPDKVRKSLCGNFEIWWDRSVETARGLEHNKPDVILIDKKSKFWTIIDFSVPNDKNVIMKENEKIENYSKLAAQIREVHHVKTTIIPLVVGALGVVSKNLRPMC